MGMSSVFIYYAYRGGWYDALNVVIQHLPFTSSTILLLLSFLLVGFHLYRWLTQSLVPLSGLIASLAALIVIAMGSHWRGRIDGSRLL